MATILFKENDLLELVHYDKFMKFICKIRDKYDQDVPYHNDLHASDVAQHCNVILKT